MLRSDLFDLAAGEAIAEPVQNELRHASDSPYLPPLPPRTVFPRGRMAATGMS